MDKFEKLQAIESVKYVIKARWVFVTAAVTQVFLFFLIGKNTSSMTLPFLALTAGLIYGINFAYWLYIRRDPEKISERGLKIVRILQILGDDLVISLMLYFDRTVTIFVSSFYLVTLMTASVVYKKEGIYWSAFLAFVLYTILATLEYRGFFSAPIADYYVPLKGLFKNYLRNLIMFGTYITGASVFSAALSDVFHNRLRRLVEQRNELVEKTEVLTKRTTELTSTKNYLNEALIKSDKIRLEVTEARQSLEMEKNKVDAIIQNLTTGLIVLDQENRISLINGEAIKMFRIGKEEVLGRSLADLRSGDFKKLKLLIQSKDGTVKKKEMVLSGEPERILGISTASVVDYYGQSLGQMIMLDDITREKTIDRLKSEFVTIAAHQLRTPLSAIKWAISLVLDEDLGRINTKQQEVLQQGYQSNERMVNLINDLLNVARIEEGRFLYEFSKVSFSELVQKTIDEVQITLKIKGVVINLEKPSDDKLTVTVDVEKIKLVLENLLENAVNYSPLSSVVTISLKRNKTDLICAIKDQGMGIAKNQQPRVFSKFFRGDNAVKMETEGTGLGLFIAKNIIESHSGRIWFETEENKGTTFYFSLPISK